MKIIERIFSIMEEKNIKQTKLAESAGVSKGVVTNWKRRGTDPPAASMVNISKLLGVSVYYLLTGMQEDDLLPLSASNTNLTDDQCEVLNVWEKLSYENKIIAKGELYKLMKDQVHERENRFNIEKVAE